MGANIRNGAPLDQRSLCETCRHAHIERGYRESEELVVCQLTFPGHRVSFRVRQCSGQHGGKGTDSQADGANRLGARCQGLHAEARIRAC